MDKCVILLALIACSHAILWAEGRQLKYKEKEETARHESNNINLQQNAAELKVDLQSTKPSVDIPCAENTLHVTGKKEIFPPIGFGESAASYKNDFRPTTPGNSPGVGHKHAKDEEEEKEIFPPTSFGESTASDKNDFQPTTAGNSPGAGHKHPKDEEDEKEIFPPIGFGESAASDKEDFRPTTPGNSPGVGHKHAKDEEDVESKVVVNHSLNSGFKNGVRPTPAPGHTPKTKA
ncbi:hypothetical protein Pint_28088 [Pistacia integerrima]|uniref:Uncharacterized protein n=1 Tax=Pistacia integerrima TaxID=434235 RepID=A0ACC0YTB6_9ROSI|nr:hypothetical protein Pint_28088 [Pistacia integerrima]